MKNLSKREQRLIKRYPNLFNNPLFLNPKTFDYRIINGTPVWNVTLASSGYWSTLVYSATDNTTIEQYLENNYCPEEFAVELDERVEGLEQEALDVDERLTSAESDIDTLQQITARALLIPIPTITNTELVGIGADKEQKRVKIGDGLVYDTTTDTLRVGGGLTSHLYRHKIKFNENATSYINIGRYEIITGNSTPITTLQQFLGLFGILESEHDKVYFFDRGVFEINPIGESTRACLFYKLAYGVSADAWEIVYADRERMGDLPISTDIFTDTVEQIF